MRFTVFPDQFAKEKREADLPWADIATAIANAPEYASRDACPWLSLAVYGDAASANHCLRNSANVLAITGLEGDYDGGQVSIADAAQRAKAAGLTACLYTSSSNTPDAPRWRILVPLSREYPLAARAGLMDRLNGVMGGILTTESWTQSQAFLFGRVRGVEYRCINV
ncbi:MAG: hypothetical protein AB7O04_06140 [Hyphomonadaceae bacterium]